MAGKKRTSKTAPAADVRPHRPESDSVEGFPLTGGKVAGWAGGIAYSVGWVNFVPTRQLSDGYRFWMANRA